MKSLITEDSLTIEGKGKGIECIEVDNILDFIILSNHVESLYLEGDDRRHYCLEISDIYAQNIPYFKNLRKLCFNDNCYNHFYTYMLNYIPTENIRETWNTDLKQEIMDTSRSSSLRFLNI